MKIEVNGKPMNHQLVFKIYMNYDYAASAEITAFYDESGHCTHGRVEGIENALTLFSILLLAKEAISQTLEQIELKEEE